jgi:hypothetical protein
MKKNLVGLVPVAVATGLLGLSGCSKDSSNPYGSSTGASSFPPTKHRRHDEHRV